MISLISAEELRDTADVLVIDARRRGEYLSGHIPGAVWMAWEAWCEPAPRPELRRDGYWGLLAERDQRWFRRRLEELGVSRHRPVVVYADGVRSKGRDGRIAWMLHYLGAQDVRLLDGGWAAWLRSNQTVDTDTPQPAPGSFMIAYQHDRRMRLADLVAARRADVPPLLIDTRSLEEFAGKKYRYLPRRGHIPGAVSVPFSHLFRADERYVSASDYHRILPNGPGHPVVAYCEVGVRATTFALLHEIHTGEPVAVFDGSLMEWSLDPELPIEVGTSAGSQR